MKTKVRKGWEAVGHAYYQRSYGPLQVHAYRHMDWSDPTKENAGEWRWFVKGLECDGSISIASLGVDWFDDNADDIALKAVEKTVKEIIRGWLK